METREQIKRRLEFNKRVMELFDIMDIFDQKCREIVALIMTESRAQSKDSEALLRALERINGEAI